MVSRSRVKSTEEEFDLVVPRRIAAFRIDLPDWRSAAGCGAERVWFHPRPQLSPGPNSREGVFVSRRLSEPGLTP